MVKHDNMSCMKLEQNGRASSGQRTKHIAVRFYWLKDRIAKANFKIEYCPTEEMIGDFLASPCRVSSSGSSETG